MKHHVGTVALAAFCLPIFRLPRLLLGFFQKKLYLAALESHTDSGGHSACVTCCEVACAPCLRSENSLFRYMNSSLLVYVAARGYNLLDAAYASYHLFSRCAFRVRAIANAAHFALLIGKLSVSFTVAAIIAVVHQVLFFYASSFSLFSPIFLSPQVSEISHFLFEN